MRSRFSAYALGLGEYLVDTLSAHHEDLATCSRQELADELSLVRSTQRFLGLRIVCSSIDEALHEGEVLFVARIFEKGADRSFGELSRFVREEGAWCYVDGVTLPRARLPENLDLLTRSQFVALAEDDVPSTDGV
jgi:SEC-C motif-containing protein